jgi:hypothetical protein
MTKKDRHLEIEIDPERAEMWREAWKLLLTGDYTLKEICEELHKRGYTRRSGKPWVEVDPETGRVTYATSQLSRSFHSPFYAGWVASETYGIKRGEVRGTWEPIISDEDFERGLAVLAKHDENRTRTRRYTYVLAGLLYMRVTA